MKGREAEETNRFKGCFPLDFFILVGYVHPSVFLSQPNLERWKSKIEFIVSFWYRSIVDVFFYLSRASVWRLILKGGVAG